MAADRFASARFAVRVSVVAKLVSQLLGILAVLTLVPALVAVAGGATSGAIRYAAVIAVFAGAWLAGRHIPEPRLIQTNEAIVSVALIFVIASLAMAFPIMGYGASFVDAWFEAVSGITTTGLSTLALDDKPWPFLFGRGWMQWVGGVGVVVLALALFVAPGEAARGLGFSDQETSNTVGGTRAHAKRVVYVYLALTATGVVLLLLSGAPLLDALVHCMAAVSTGGFANHADSLASVPPLQTTIINGLCIAGAISFHVYYLALVTSRERTDNQFHTLLVALAVVFTFAWLFNMATDGSLAAGDIVTMVISAQTTAGFMTVDIGTAPGWFVLILAGCMFVGGGIGSTSGGVKLGRVFFVFSQARMQLVRASMSNRIVTRSRSRRGHEHLLQDVMAVLGWFIVALGVSWFIFVAAGYPPLLALFEVTSALSTAGLSSGITDATLPTGLKVVLCADMLLGRVEVVALLIVILPRTWFGRRRRLR